MLDLRFPAGWMFATMGVLLAGYGALSGIRIDLIWGSVLIAAAVCMLALAYRASSRDQS